MRRVDPPEPRLFFNSEADEDEPDEVIQELETEAEPEEAEPEIDPKAEAEMIINQAREEAGQILTEAIRQGESLKEQAKKEGYAQGYQEGIEAATAEMREKQAEAQRLWRKRRPAINGGYGSPKEKYSSWPVKLPKKLAGHPFPSSLKPGLAWFERLLAGWLAPRSYSCAFPPRMKSC